jgi:hypothetical protein
MFLVSCVIVGIRDVFCYNMRYDLKCIKGLVPDRSKFYFFLCCIIYLVLNPRFHQLTYRIWDASQTKAKIVNKLDFVAACFVRMYRNVIENRVEFIQNKSDETSSFIFSQYTNES